jgi:hypothetical protein
MVVQEQNTTSIHNQITTRIKQKGEGNIFFPSDFVDLGSPDAVRQSLSRLTKDKIIERLAHGVYLYAKNDPLLGTLYPSTEEIAIAIAKRDKARIMPTGLFALHKLGLSTQIPMKVIYLTDGTARRIQLGKQSITFKNTSPKKLSIKGGKTGLVIQALQQLGKEQVNEQILKKIKEILAPENTKLIGEDAPLAPAWIAQILFSIIKQRNTND